MLVYRNPEQVSRLIERIYSPSDYFYVHVDRRNEGALLKYGRRPWEQWRTLLPKYPNVFLDSKYKTPRCSFKMVEAILDVMNCCRGSDYDYFVNLTGQCYPIKPMSEIRDELERRSTAYMEYFKLPSSDHWKNEKGGLRRIRYYYIASGDNRSWIQIPRLNWELPCGLQPYGGGYMYILPRRFIEHILDYVSNHPEIMSYYKYSWMSGEMFFQTIIMNSTLRSDVIDDNRWYVRWGPTPGHGHPLTLGKNDFNEVIRSDKLFARKFDITVDSDVLDLIDEVILRN
jgi:hypothetical protein